MAAGQTPIGANVTNATTEIMPANNARQWAVVVNASDTDMYVALDADAVLNKGILLIARGGSIVLNRKGDIFSNGPINGIHGGSGDKVAVGQEGI